MYVLVLLIVVLLGAWVTAWAGHKDGNLWVFDDLEARFEAKAVLLGHGSPGKSGQSRVTSEG
jgi:hypothetical protein